MKTIFLTILFVLVTITGAYAQSKNAQTVMNNYAAFGKGDIAAILATLAPDCEWTHPGNPAIVPFAGTFRGADEIGKEFFGAIPSAIQITEFSPSLAGEDGNTVITSVFIKGKAVSTGKEYENTAEMRWTFNSAGMVTKYNVIVDTAALEAALTAK
ncbi:nuclear transport factor 2 family protein [Sphingobacteriales bacterium UPWRP_1]|nr:hypothetical protein BVG80_12575 [Sphingobacteriales bacterium TSM_CSM]PSJ77862.1 nuclear transport factor 2 family protein [Sphingobacteriales bacterium UPWRP_1]